MEGDQEKMPVQNSQVYCKDWNIILTLTVIRDDILFRQLVTERLIYNNVWNKRATWAAYFIAQVNNIQAMHYARQFPLRDEKLHSPRRKYFPLLRFLDFISDLDLLE